MYFGSGNYKRIIATAERSAGNEAVGDIWNETKSFDRKTPIEDIVHWANYKKCSGKLVITIDEGSEA